MSFGKTLLMGAAVLVAPFASADDAIEMARSADIVVLGEVHDNPHHHAKQLRYLTELAPKAVVFEMLTPEEADVLADVARDRAAMEAASTGFHWSNIADYAALLAASEVIIGAAMPRGAVREAFGVGAAAVFGEAAAEYGLTDELAAEELETRMDLQFDAHCEAMPREMMGGMVEAQRLRDAAFARATIAAADAFGTPVVLITGNGHARLDWGVPAYLAKVRPDWEVFALGQSEDGRINDGGFTQVADAPAVERPDPCAAFR